LPLELTAGIKQPVPFGFEPYTVKREGFPPRVKSFAPSKSENVSYFEQTGKDWKWVPAGIYIPHSDWTKTAPKPGKWGKYKKQTFTEEVMK
jgi:hypothetical protein